MNKLISRTTLNEMELLSKDNLGIFLQRSIDNCKIHAQKHQLKNVVFFLSQWSKDQRDHEVAGSIPGTSTILNVD